MKKRHVIAVLAVVVLGGLYLSNASWRGHPTGRLSVLAHRGVHQTFQPEGVSDETCTASRIDRPTHPFLENTLPSIRRAFDLGADAVEIDVHPTTDGEFAVFHDWTLDCRTNGKGVTREHSMAELRTLDAGYGYTSDGGKTYPLRGKGVGMISSLGEVLAAFPDKHFLINIKSDDAREGALLAAYLKGHGVASDQVAVFGGGDTAIGAFAKSFPQVRTVTKSGAKACLKAYLLKGWMGAVPAACRHTLVFAPGGYSALMWGWPNLFLERMQKADSEVYFGGTPDLKNPRVMGIDTGADLKRIPPGWRGGVSTERIEVVGPLLKSSAKR